jgi:hypothetical protein
MLIIWVRLAREFGFAKSFPEREEQHSPGSLGTPSAPWVKPPQVPNPERVALAELLATSGTHSGFFLHFGASTQGAPRVLGDPGLHCVSPSRNRDWRSLPTEDLKMTSCLLHENIQLNHRAQCLLAAIKFIAPTGTSGAGGVGD